MKSFSCCATSMATANIVLNMKKNVKGATKTQTEFNLFDGRNTEHHLSNKAIEVLSDNVERKLHTEEDYPNESKYKRIQSSQ